MKKRLLIICLSLLSSFAISNEVDEELFEVDCNGNEICINTKVEMIASLLSNRIHRNFSSTQGLRQLHAKVHVSMNYDGTIEVLAIDQSSGDADYDQSVIDAIKAAFPIEQVAMLKREIYEKHLRDNVIHFGDPQFALDES